MTPFADLPAKAKAIELLRWLCVPVAAVVACEAPHVVLGLLLPRAMAQLPGTPVAPLSDFRRFVLTWAMHLVLGAAFVIAGTKVAPRRRFATASVLAVLWILLSLQSHVLVHLAHGTPHYAHFAVAAASALAGAAYIHYSEKVKAPARDATPAS